MPVIINLHKLVEVEESMRWREKKGMSRDSWRNRKLFSFSLVMTIFLASLTTLFVVVPFNVEAETAPETVTYYFNGYNKLGEVWTTWPSYMVNGDENTYASTITSGDVELCNGNTCPGTDLGTITKVELCCKGYHSGGYITPPYIRLRPVFPLGDGGNHDFSTSSEAAWSTWYDITNDPNAPTWTWSAVDNLDCDVVAYTGGATLYCSKVDIRVTYTPPSNSPPVNGAPSYGGWDMGDPMVFPGDNCYAQYREYTITVVYTDDDGYEDFDYVELRIGNYLQDPGTTRTTFRYDEDTNTFSQITDGQEKWDLESTNLDVSEGDNDITVTWRFKPQWDADEESNVYIKLYCCDDEIPPASDTDPYSPDFDVVTTLLTDTLECDDPDVPDRVDIKSSNGMDFKILYADEPGSKTPSSYYPSSASEFKEVFLFRVAEGGEPLGTPEQVGSITAEEMEEIGDGGGTIPFDVPAEVNTHDYRLQVSMADEDYGEGGVGWLTNLDETVITDRIEITLQEASEAGNRINISTGVDYTVQARLDYDNHIVGEGDSLTANCGALEWDGEKWVKEGYSKSSAGDLTFSVSSGNEATYGITTIYDTAPDPEQVIWDEILVNWAADQYTVDAGTEVTITLDDVIYDYDNGDVSGYQYDVRETFCDQDPSLIKDDYGSSSFTVTPTIAGFYNYTIPSLSESEYGLTANQTNCADQGDTQNISLTVKQKISLVKNSENDGINYITWGATASIQASELAGASYADLQNNDVIQMFNATSGDWDIIYIHPGGPDFTINRWNHTRIHCTNAKTFSVTPDGSVDSSQNKTLTYSVDNHGYHYYTWSNDFSIKASVFATNSKLDLTNQPISVYNPTTGKWKGYTEIPGLPQVIKDGMDFYINSYDVICFKVASGTENAYYDSSNYEPT